MWDDPLKGILQIEKLLFKIEERLFEIIERYLKKMILILNNHFPIRKSMQTS